MSEEWIEFEENFRVPEKKSYGNNITLFRTRGAYQLYISAKYISLIRPNEYCKIAYNPNKRQYRFSFKKERSPGCYSITSRQDRDMRITGNRICRDLFILGINFRNKISFPVIDPGDGCLYINIDEGVADDNNN